MEDLHQDFLKAHMDQLKEIKIANLRSGGVSERMITQSSDHREEFKECESKLCSGRERALEFHP